MEENLFLSEEQSSTSIKKDSNLELYVSNICTCPCADFFKELPIEPTPEEERKRFILSTVSRTDEYLREHQIAKLLHFLFTKVLAHLPENPIAYLENVLDDCMVYRAGLGIAPVLYEEGHLEAVIASFDPSRRGWLNSIQVSQIFTTLGLTLDTEIGERTFTSDLFKMLKHQQEQELLELVSAGNGAPKEIDFLHTIFN